MNNATHGFEDMASDDLGDTPAIAAATSGPALFRSECRKCGGSGVYRGPSSHGRRCFECDGRGFHEYKTTDAQRHAAREQRKASKARKQAAAVEAWAAANRVAHAWIVARRDSFDFARSMDNALQQWGSLTANQLAAVQRCIDRDAAAAAARVERAAAAPVVTVQPIADAFQRAADAGLKRLVLRLDSFKFKPAKATSANAGALYVTDAAEGTYLGKIAGGKFLAVRDCSADQSARIVAAASDPAGAAKVYGRREGKCSICGLTLTDPASIEAGIGPICSSKFGF